MKQISIYIHWPFCLSLCPYCDFNSHIADSIDYDAWLCAYIKEITHFNKRIFGRRVRSIFFGGGTPSLMDPKLVDGIINYIASIATIDAETEITLEANPTSYEAKKFECFRASGINRVSIGLQSLNDSSLKILGRKHSSKEAIQAVNSAAKIFKHYSFDLIYAIPEQTLSSWQEELKLALEIAGEHISLYQLTIEKGTPFFKLYHNKELILPSNDDSADMYEWTKDYLGQNNYHHYEISNYSQPNKECIHNLCYWYYDEYIGIGPGAHSRLHNDSNCIESVMMTHKPDKWLMMVDNYGHGIQTQQLLTKEEIVKEAFMMGTRLSCGINEQHFYKITDFKFAQILNFDIVNQYQNLGLLEFEDSNNISETIFNKERGARAYNNRSMIDNIEFKNMTWHNIKLTSKGLLLHNYIIPRLLNANN